MIIIINSNLICFLVISCVNMRYNVVWINFKFVNYFCLLVCEFVNWLVSILKILGSIVVIEISEIIKFVCVNVCVYVNRIMLNRLVLIVLKRLVIVNVINVWLWFRFFIMLFLI